MKTIVFQGDSLTECMRWHGYPENLGCGWGTIVASHYSYNYPGKYRFVNSGNGGDKSDQMLARIKEETIDLDPDIVSILIGVNDVWHQLDHGVVYTEEFFRSNLSSAIEQIKAAKPEVKIILFEPYVIKGYATVSTEEQPDRWELFRSRTERRAVITRELSEKYKTEFVPLQAQFDEAAKLYGDHICCVDGVHTRPYGSMIMAKSFIKAFDKIENLNAESLCSDVI